MLALHLASGLAGSLLACVVLLDALETVVLPRRVCSAFRLSAWYYRLSWRPWMGLVARLSSQGRREALLGHFGPLSLVVLLGIDGIATEQAKMTFAMARHAVVDLSQVVLTRYEPCADDRLPADELARLRHGLEEEGLRLREGAAADARLAALRAMYEPYVDALARRLLIALPRWLPDERKPDNWQVAPWDRLIAGREVASLAAYHSEDHF
jgi:hypothetical protein